jgi:hypothetical protein
MRSASIGTTPPSAAARSNASVAAGNGNARTRSRAVKPAAFQSFATTSS